MKIGSKHIFTNSILRALILFALSMTSAYGQTVSVQPIGTVLDGGRHYLKMQVENCTNKDIEVFLADLPWGKDRLGLILYSAGKLAGESLKERFPAGDSPDTKVRIQAGSHVEGKIDLDYRFFDIARYEKSTNLLIFWAYDLSLITGGRPQFVGGMIPLQGSSPPESGVRIACK